MGGKKRNYRVAGFLACLFLVISFGVAFGGQRIDGNLQLGTATVAGDANGNVTNSAGSFLGKIRTTGGGAAGDLFQAGLDGSGRIWWRIGSTGAPLFWNGSSYASPLTNPMTTAGDMIVGGTDGAPSRAPAGTDGYVWTMDPSTHLPGWAATSTLTNAICFTDAAPASGRTLPIWRAPAAAALSGTHYLLAGATSLAGQIQICDGNAANCVDTQAADVTATAGANADGTVTPLTIGAGDYVVMKETTLTGDSPVSYTGCFDYGWGAVPCTDLSVSIWEDFEFSTLNTTNLAAHQHGTGGVWTIADTASKLSMSASGQKSLKSCPGNVTDAGTTGLKADNTAATTTPAYLAYTFPSPPTTLSYSYWLYIASFPAYTTAIISQTSGVNLSEMYNSGSAITISTIGAVNIPAITFPTVPAWYFITMKTTLGSTMTMHVYDANGNELAGSPQSGTAYTGPWSSLEVGLTATIAAASFILYFDNLLIDLTGATDPLGP
ncbi:MAG: hypothetical protein ABSG91_07005 [Syntrophobacteraceae bacterium]|jgi:hypothetical protein